MTCFMCLMICMGDNHSLEFYPVGWTSFCFCENSACDWTPETPLSLEL